MYLIVLIVKGNSAINELESAFGKFISHRSDPQIYFDLLLLAAFLVVRDPLQHQYQ